MKESNQSKEFARQATESRQGMLKEFVWFLQHNKKWWLTPIILMLLLIGGLVIIGGAAPFIYTLF